VLHILPSGFSTGPWHQLHLSARTREQLVLQRSAEERCLFLVHPLPASRVLVARRRRSEAR
jgi:hypothetical protein